MKSDRETNYGTMTKVMRNGKFEEVNWSNVLVGDIVMTEA
jgi:magnesium-transporting ATPase (P-type)